MDYTTTILFFNQDKNFKSISINGVDLHFLYDHLVAVNKVKTSTKYSKTTTRHINQFIYSVEEKTEQELKIYAYNKLKESFLKNIDIEELRKIILERELKEKEELKTKKHKI